MDLGHPDCNGLSDIGKVRAVNEDQFVIAELRKSMVVHRSSGALGEPSPVFGGTLGRLLLVADTGGETADTRVSATAVRTIADYMLNIMPWFYRLGGPQEDDFLRELVSALEQCHTRLQAVADATPGAPEVGAVLTMTYVTWPWSGWRSPSSTSRRHSGHSSRRGCRGAPATPRPAWGGGRRRSAPQPRSSDVGRDTGGS